MDRNSLIFENQFSKELNNWNVKDELKRHTLKELNDNQPKFGYAVAAYNIDKGLNIGTMIRTSVLFGADEFFIFGDNKWDKRSTVGAQNYIKITKLTNKDLFEELNNRGYYPVIFEPNKTNFDPSEIIHTKNSKPCFIFGSENEGIPAKYLEQTNDIYSIPQYGVLRSLNVSVACGIILYSYVNYINE